MKPGPVSLGRFEEPEEPEKLEKPSKTTTIHIYESDLELARSLSQGSNKEVFRDILQRLLNKKEGSMVTRHVELEDKFPCGTRFEDLGVFHCKETSHAHQIKTLRECAACARRKLQVTVEKTIAIHGQKADVFHTELKVREHEAEIAFQTVLLGDVPFGFTCDPQKSYTKEGLLEVVSKECPQRASGAHPIDICHLLNCKHLHMTPEALESEAVKRALQLHSQKSKRKQAKKKPGVQELERV